MISVCIITKNEKKKLDRNLKSLSGYKLEVVVVDTGSTDGTKELLEDWMDRTDKKFSLVCGDFVWCGDFAKARNYSLSLASNDKILVLDSDEVLLKMELRELEEQMAREPEKIGRLRIHDKLENNGEETLRVSWLARIFDRRHCHYVGRIHEQVLPIGSSPGQGEGCLDDPYYLTGVEILHDGYLGTEEHHRAKSLRNIALLEEELRENGDDPYILYHLGKNHSRIGDHQKAAEAFAQALSFDLDPRLEYVVDMVEGYGYALINAGLAHAALGLESVYDTFGNTAEFRLMMGHVYMHNCLFDKAVEAFLSAAQCQNASTQGMNSYLAYYNAGVVYEVLGQVGQALELYRKCGSYQPARNRIKAMQG